MLFMMFYVPLIKYWSNGPLWSQSGIEVNECENSWWRNLLYINNLVDPNHMVNILIIFDTHLTNIISFVWFKTNTRKQKRKKNVNEVLN